ncbi:retrovirus-related pol polyprotein from transposon TNT 1-94 [Tanacetum coccineum]
MDLCRPMRIQSINGQKYILVIVNDYSRFTWVNSKIKGGKVPEFQFVNQTPRDYYKDVKISHQISIACTPQQNGVVKRRNQTLVEAARTMRIFSKAPLFLWLIIETIHINFDELTTMASEQFSSGPSVASLVSAVVAPEPVDSTGTPSSTTTDQDAPSLSTLETHQESKSLVISPSVEEEFHDIEVTHLDNDPLFGVPIQEPKFEESFLRDVIPSNVHLVNQSPEHLRKWTKDHSLES